LGATRFDAVLHAYIQRIASGPPKKTALRCACAGPTYFREGGFFGYFC
jgi:hypothetical protein